MKKVLIIVGHENIENLTHAGLRSWRSIETLKKSTGASGERDYFSNKVVPKLKELLEQAGVEVKIVDALYHEDVYSQDYDLCVAMHYDGGGSGNRCMASAPNKNITPPYISEEAMAKSDEFINKWLVSYPEDTGVTVRQDLITAGMYDYYCWDYVGFDTPSVILEHFNHTSLRGEELKGEPDVVAKADAKVILNFLGTTLPDLCVPLNEDISTEVEDRYGLKNYEWYNKYWTLDELLKFFIEVTKKYEKLQKENDEVSSKLDWTEKQLEKAIREEAELGSKLKDERKVNAKLTADALIKDNKISTLTDEVKAFKTQQGVLEGVIDKLGDEIESLKEDNLILTNANSSLEVEKEQIIEQKFTDWLSEQTFKTKLKYIFKIIRNK